MADLKRNIDKSEILLTLEDKVKLEMYADIFDCQMGFWTIKYLGAPVSGSRIRVKDLHFIEENEEKLGWLAWRIYVLGLKESFDRFFTK
jgi:hypothetical protein